LTEQKLNDFSDGEAKIGEEQSRQPNSKYNLMQYTFCEKDIGLRNVQRMGFVAKPQKLENFREFVC